MKTSSPLSHTVEKQQRKLWLYILVFTVIVEILIFVVSLLFGFIAGSKTSEHGELLFPWLSWASTSLIVPCVMIFAVHIAVGLFPSREKEDTWYQLLPEKLQKTYLILSKAPAVVLFGGIAVIGVTLVTLDGALDKLESLFSSFIPYLPYILAGLGFLAFAFIGIAAFLRYRTQKMYAEYEYRRAVLKETGHIITDKKHVILSSDGELLTAIASPQHPKALPSAEVIEVDVTDTASKK